MSIKKHDIEFTDDYGPMDVYDDLLQGVQTSVAEGAVQIGTPVGTATLFIEGTTKSRMITKFAGTPYPVVSVVGFPKGIKAPTSKFKLGDSEKPVDAGVTVIVGGPGSGKTSLIASSVRRAVQDKLKGVELFSYMEPMDIALMQVWNVNPVYIADDPAKLVQTLTEFMSPYNIANTLIIDSVSLLLMANWSHFSTTTGGLNPGFFYFLTALDREAMKQGKSIVLSINPNLARADLLASIVSFASGRVSTLVELRAPGEGVVTEREAGRIRTTLTWPEAPKNQAPDSNQSKSDWDLTPGDSTFSLNHLTRKN
jgi:hypothetical protein